MARIETATATAGKTVHRSAGVRLSGRPEAATVSATASITGRSRSVAAGVASARSTGSAVSSGGFSAASSMGRADQIRTGPPRAFSVASCSIVLRSAGVAEFRFSLRTSNEPESFARVIIHLRRYAHADARIQVLPQIRNFLRRTPVRCRLHHGAPIDHRDGVFGALMENDGRHSAVLG